VTVERERAEEGEMNREEKTTEDDEKEGNKRTSRSSLLQDEFE
jgi:hypothetical protein